MKINEKCVSFLSSIFSTGFIYSWEIEHIPEFPGLTSLLLSLKETHPETSFTRPTYTIEIKYLGHIIWTDSFWNSGGLGIYYGIPMANFNRVMPATGLGIGHFHLHFTLPPKKSGFSGNIKWQTTQTQMAEMWIWEKALVNFYYFQFPNVYLSNDFSICL